MNGNHVERHLGQETLNEVGRFNLSLKSYLSKNQVQLRNLMEVKGKRGEQGPD